MTEAAGIHSDAPTKDDLLDRRRYVEALADVIRDSDTPLTVAIYGSWGAGKTSLMMQLRDLLAPPGSAASDNSIATVWFDPWMHQFDESPAIGLLHATADQLKVAGERVVRDALKKLALAVGEDLQLPFLGIRVSKILKIREELAESDLRKREAQTRVRQHFGEVIEAARKGRDRIVFFIDDLDRCQPARALALLEALKLYLDFEGCVFVLGVDREPLEAAVANEYRTLGLSAERYLDKIIQLPFVIPAIGKESMDDFVLSQIPEELAVCAPILALAAADEPRAVKRMSNTLLLNHRLAQGATFSAPYDPRLLALIVLIQNETPSLSRQLRLNPSLIHDLYAGPSESSDPDAVSLWDEYVSMKPRLADALRLIDIPEELDLTPYLTLTTLSSPDEVSSSTHRGRVYISFERVDARWAGRIDEELTKLGWSTARTGAASKIAPDPDDTHPRISVSDAVVVVIGPRWADRVGPSDPIVREIDAAKEAGIPLLPVLVDGARFAEIDFGGVELLQEIQMIEIDRSDPGRGLAVLERTLDSVASRS